MINKKFLQIAATSLAFIMFLTGCGSNSASNLPGDNNENIRKVKVAYDQASKPISWLDENGNPTGYDVEVMKLVDELLPKY